MRRLARAALGGVLAGTPGVALAGSPSPSPDGGPALQAPAAALPAAELAGASAVAAAPQPDAPAPEPSLATPGWRAAADVGTDFPLALGVRGQVEAPFRVRLSTSVGYLPGVYVDALNATLVGFGAYSQPTADLIRSTLKSSLIWRTHAGVRPFRARGFFAEAGYGLVALGGSSTAADLIAGVTGQPVPSEGGSKTLAFKARSTLHMLDVEVGWEWFLASRLHLRVALGGAFTLGASTTLTPDYTPRAPRVTSAFARYGESYLDDLFTSYVFSPVVSLGVGYSFVGP